MAVHVNTGDLIRNATARLVGEAEDDIRRARLERIATDLVLAFTSDEAVERAALALREQLGGPATEKDADAYKAALAAAFEVPILTDE